MKTYTPAARPALAARCAAFERLRSGSFEGPATESLRLCRRIVTLTPVSGATFAGSSANPEIGASDGDLDFFPITDEIRQISETRPVWQIAFAIDSCNQPISPCISRFASRAAPDFLWRPATELERLRCLVGNHDVQGDLKKLRFPPRLPRTQDQ